MNTYWYCWACLVCGVRLNAAQFPVQCPMCGSVYGIQHVSGPNLPPGVLTMRKPMPSTPFVDPEPADMTEEQRRTAHRLLAEAFDG